MRIIFMGTPEFAVPPLRALLRVGHEVAAVFTRPDRPKGRRMAVTPPPVKVLAQAAGIPVFQPVTFRDGAAAAQIAALRPDLIVVAAYGRILPKAVLEIPRFGCINVHASLLPKYRGASPIQAALLNGEAVTGVTAMQMSEGLDTGDILMSESTPVGPEENAQELTGRLSRLGAGLLVRTLEALRAGTLHPVPQNDAESCYAPMLTKKMSPVDWNLPAGKIHNRVRGLYPWPGASTVCRRRHLKILRSRVAADHEGPAGSAFSPDGRFLVCCGGGTALELLTVQPEGGKKMSGADFLRGHPVDGILLT